MTSTMEFETRILKIHVYRTIRDHPYIKSARGLGGWVQKKAIFPDVQYCIYAKNHSGWAGQKKSKNMLT